MDKSIAVLIGTRPGIIKMAPLVHEVRRRGVESLVIHSGQHYSSSMDKEIMSDVGLGEPNYHIRRPDEATSHAKQTAYMLTNMEEVLLEAEPDILLVCGDANTNLSGALAARKIHTTVGHVEAGLRSFDWRMPEEHNRVIIDHISEYLFAPTEVSRRYLEEDGVPGEIFVVGNTIVDSTLKYTSDSLDHVAEQIDSLPSGAPYALLTLHREENVDDRDVLSRVLGAIGRVADDYNLPVVFPAHPRTRKRIQEFGLTNEVDSFSKLNIIDPLPYREFLSSLKNAQFVMTDSGGIQEESCILQIPCVTIRESTERPETIEVGANQLAGTNPEDIFHCVQDIYDDEQIDTDWKNPYGDGNASERIIETCLHGSPQDEFESPVDLSQSAVSVPDKN